MEALVKKHKTKQYTPSNQCLKHQTRCVTWRRQRTRETCLVMHAIIWIGKRSPFAEMSKMKYLFYRESERNGKWVVWSWVEWNWWFRKRRRRSSHKVADGSRARSGFRSLHYLFLFFQERRAFKSKLLVLNKLIIIFLFYILFI